MAAIDCDGGPTPYAGYKPAGFGANFCLYRAPGKPPIVRYLSFLYDIAHGDSAAALRTIRLDHDRLAEALRGERAVVVDVHENQGGYNPFVFASWFASRPWGHPTVHVRVDRGLAEEDLRAALWGNEDNVVRYKEAAARGDAELTFPFLCTGDDCVRVGPRLTELVTRGRVALITGPGCASSCDQLTTLWTTFAEGPVVGRQPSHAYTTVRHGFPVVGPKGEALGRFSVALSWEAYAGAEPLEGRRVPLDWEAPDDGAPWLDRAVAEATSRLTGR